MPYFNQTHLHYDCLKMICK